MINVKRHSRKVIRQLQYDFRQFTVPDFVAYLIQTRQRDLILTPTQFKPGLHGIWIRAETADYVFYDGATHPIHQVHHILHELGHIILKHEPHSLKDVLPEDLLAGMREQGDANPVGHCRQWEPDASWQEREAEAFVYWLQREILVAGRLVALTHPETSIDELKRFTWSLAYND
jgi:hypothetical protein